MEPKGHACTEPAAEVRGHSGEPALQRRWPLVRNRARSRKACVPTCPTESDRKREGSWRGGTEQEARRVFIEVKVTARAGLAPPPR